MLDAFLSLFKSLYKKGCRLYYLDLGVNVGYVYVLHRYVQLLLSFSMYFRGPWRIISHIYIQKCGGDKHFKGKNEVRETEVVG